MRASEVLERWLAEPRARVQLGNRACGQTALMAQLRILDDDDGKVPRGRLLSGEVMDSDS